MKCILSIKAIFIVLSFASIAFSAEPQMMRYKKSSKERKVASIRKTESLTNYEINNGEMIKLYSFNTKKKASKKITVEVFAKNFTKKQAISL